MTTTHFNRETWNEYTGLQTLTTAAAHVGITITNPIAQLKQAFKEQTTVDQIANELTRDILTIEDHDTWIEQATQRIQRAKAFEELQEAFNRRWDVVRRQTVATQQQTTIDTITPQYEKIVVTLIKAAQQLPENDPLNLERIIEANASEAYKTTTTALTKLAAYVSCFDPLQTIHDIPRSLNEILPLITITGTTAEQVDSLGNTTNSHELDTTQTVRTLANDLEHNTDQTLINIARGNYPGITLTTQQPINTTAQAARTAFQRTRTNTQSSVRIMR